MPAMPATHMEQWDRFEIPWPFSKAVIVLGEPIAVQPGAKDEQLEGARIELEEAMNYCADAARQRLEAFIEA